MEHELNSEGKCSFCDKLLPQKEIGKHLASHLQKTEKDDGLKNPETYCHILVEADLSSLMFLHLLVKGKISMKKIDDFLRDIWLECCGHMSAFGNKDYEISAAQKVLDVFATKVKIYYDYDFGDTTRVFIKGIKNYKLKIKEDIILLSRNEPLKLICSECETQPAAHICTICNGSFYCTDCSAKHEGVCEDFQDYSKMPVVNSPRMGICGYTGGLIDTNRDGVAQ